MGSFKFSENQFGTTLHLINYGKLQNALAGSVVETQGFTDKGDGGAAQWRKTGVTGLTASQTPAQTGNGTLTDALGHEWSLEPCLSANFHAFGAVGDDATDDTLAVISAIASSSVEILTGIKGSQFRVSTIPIPSFTRIEHAYFHLLDNVNDDCLQLERNATNVTLRHIEIDGNRANNTAGEGININGTSDTVVCNCEVYRTASHGIVAFPGDISNTRLKINKNYVHDTDGESIQVRKIIDSEINNNVLNEWGAGFNAIEIQNVSESSSISYNTLESSTASQFGIESTGDDSVLNSSISFNKMKSPFTGISGKFENCEIIGNQWKAGQGGHRSGIEVIGVSNTISLNKIYDGTIVVASNGSNSPSINARGTLISDNLVQNRSADKQGIQVGAVSTATGTPTSEDIQIKNNTLDFSNASGTGIRVITVGDYGSQSQVQNIDVINNTLIGPAVFTGTEGIRTNPLAGSGKVKIKGNTFKRFGKAIRLNNDNLTDVFIRNNDANDNISTFISDASTTTNIVNIDNDT